MEQKISTKSLVESALMAGIITIINIATLYIPFLYTIGLIVLPIIVALIYYRNGMKYSVGAIVVSTIIVAMLLNPILAITSGISYGIVGTVLGYCLKNEKKTYNTLVVLIIACILSIIVQVWLTSILVSNTSIFQFIKNELKTYIDMFNQYINETKELYSSIGISGTQIQILDQISSIFTVEFLAMLLPATIFIGGFIQAYTTILFTQLIFRKLKYKGIESLMFSEFYISNLVGAALIAIISICGIIGSKGVTWGMFLYNAIMLITIIILSINGAAVTDYFLRKKVGMPKVARIFLLAILFMIGAPIIFSIIGFVEMMLDFRKLDPHRIRKA
jgi:uncharacterized protein YybS (DUF2232 family)